MPRRRPLHALSGRSRLAGLLTAAVVLGGCIGGGRSPIITRTVGGRERPGIFVSPYSYEHFVRGELAYQRGALREAAEEFRLARAGPEDDPLLIARLVDVLDRLGREDEAMQLLDQGDALDGDSELIAMARGNLHERHGRLDEAAEAFARAAAAAPRSEAGPLALSRVLRAQDRDEEADATLERFLDRGEGAGAARARLALAVERRDALAAAQAVRALLEAAPARASEVRDAVRVALDTDHPELALRLLQALPGEEDRESRLRAALLAGDRDRAEGILARWMPEGPTELLRVAEGYLAVGMPERAVELARVAMAADGGAPARRTLSAALRESGRTGEASLTAAPIAPGSQAWPSGPLALAEALRVAGRPGLAAETLARARRTRDAPALRLAHADAVAELGALDAALGLLDGEAPRVVAARARLLDRAGRVDDAASAYAALAVDAPGLDAATRGRVRAERQWANGQRDAAIATLRAQADHAPEDLWSRARLASMLRAEGEDGAAREVAAAALPLAIEPALRARLSAPR